MPTETTSRLTYSIVLAFTGRSALAAVENNLAGDGVSLTLAKFADAEDGAEHDISLERAESVIAEDPSLVYLEAEVAFFGSEVALWAVVGHLHIGLMIDASGPASVLVRDSAPADAEALRPSWLGGSIEPAVAKLRAVITPYLRARLDALGLP